ncbi:hypothetical protein AAG570_001174 [Ranatra chinensis]|uniref:BZIP domain-containing protein n=1 Tax=Ranatra chinensis TaxID=642074 RepID=A0ABD0YB37_9HEMI
METGENQLPDEYVQEFVLDHLEDVPVKRENCEAERLPSMLTCGGDTPPESESPGSPPPGHYRPDRPPHPRVHLHHHQPPVDEMVWLTQPLRQEAPLDLRPNCPGELPPEEWVALQPHPSVIAGPHPQRPCGLSPDIIDDDLLMCLSVRELNKRLHGFPREAVQKLKQKRRTLKNRGYAQNCRSKRLHQRHELEMTNRNLQAELHRLKMELTRVGQERDVYKHRYETLRKRFLNDPPSGPGSPELYL